MQQQQPQTNDEPPTAPQPNYIQHHPTTFRSPLNSNQYQQYTAFPYTNHHQYFPIQDFDQNNHHFQHQPFHVPLLISQNPIEHHHHHQNQYRNQQQPSAFTDFYHYNPHLAPTTAPVEYTTNFTGFSQPHSENQLIQPPPQSIQPSHYDSGSKSESERREDLKRFANDFKRRRTRLGITQEFAGRRLSRSGEPNCTKLSQSTICRFESQTLSLQNMEFLKPILERFLIWAEGQGVNMLDDGRDEGNGRSCGDGPRKRKRTPIGSEEKGLLEMFYAENPKPNTEDIHVIAKRLFLPKDTVRIWFCNQRQKQKRMNNREN